MARREHTENNEALPKFLTTLLRNGELKELEYENYRNLADGLRENFNITDLVEYSKQHTKDFPKFIDCILQSSEVYQRLVLMTRDLVYFGEAFPQNAEAIINRLLTSPEEYQRLVNSGILLARLGNTFPHHAKALIKPLLSSSSPEEYQRLVRSGVDLACLGKAFPHHAEALIKPLLTSPEEYQRLVEDELDLAYLREAFPQHAEALKNAEKILDIMREMPEWRPKNHRKHPTSSQNALRTLCILAKARNQEESVETNTTGPATKTI